MVSESADSQDAKSLYAAHIETYTKKEAYEAERSSKMLWVRGSLVIGLFLLLSFILSGDLSNSWYTLAALMFIGLVVAIRHNRTIDRALEDARLLIKVNVKSQLRLEERWHDFSQQGERYQSSDHSYANDLDLFGKGSIFQRLSTCTTRFGENTLAKWLLERAELDEIKRRQDLIADLKERVPFRQDLEKEGQRLGSEGISKDPEPFLQWAEQKPYLKDRTLLLWAAKLLPIWTCGAILLYQFKPISAWYWFVPLLIQIIILGQTYKKILPSIIQVSHREKLFSLYGAQFQRIDQEACEGTPFETLKASLRKQGFAPHQEMKKLQHLIDLLDVRHTPLLHLPLNILFLWDLRCIARLEAWQARVGPVVRQWFTWLGEVEALTSFATFAYENPDYAFPEVEKSKDPLYRAKDLGHPLLPRDERITNDVEFTPDNPLMLITGSNMSGKSTLLRAIGANSALAFSGSVVCASSLRLTWMQLGTSMRLKDSLEQGISYFMAEIYRIKHILNLRNNDTPLLFLLDEILHGTNSRERHIAAIAVMMHLLEAKAIGSISTHDLELAERCKRFGDKVQYTYLMEQVEGGEMYFDYKLRQGVSPTSNALKLMKSIGIEIPEEAES